MLKLNLPCRYSGGNAFRTVHRTEPLFRTAPVWWFGRGEPNFESNRVTPIQPNPTRSNQTEPDQIRPDRTERHPRMTDECHRCFEKD